MKGVDDTKVSTEGSKSVIKKNDPVLDLSPRIVKDPKKVAELWDRMMANASGNSISGYTVPSFGLGSDHPDPQLLQLPGTDGFRKALYSLSNPGISKFIKVEVIEYPGLVAFTKFSQRKRWYEEKCYQANDKPSLVPLGRERKGFDDPWNDENFPDGDELKGVEIPESCIWIDCPNCEGRGYTSHLEYRETKKHVKCPDCLGSGWAHGGRVCPRCDGSGWVHLITTHYDDAKRVKDGHCYKCDGKGRLKSVLTAHAKPSQTTGVTFAYYSPNQKDNIPETLIKARREAPNCSKALNYNVVLTIPSKGKFYDLKLDDFPKWGLSLKVEQQIIKLYEGLRDPKAQVESQTIKFATTVRFVRFLFRYYAPHEEFNGKNKYWEDPEGHFYEQVIWFDTATLKAYSFFPQGKFRCKGSQDAFCAVFTKMASEIGCATPLENSSGKVKPAGENQSNKRRWIFILLGILGGWFGLHYLYAGRKKWFMMHWFLLCAQFTQQKVPALSSLLGRFASHDVFALLVVLMFVYSIFFMKKDGNGKRM